MPQFAPDLANFNDIAGYGAFDVGHYREHLQFVQVLSQQSPTVLIPDFDFLSLLTAGQARRSVLDSHQNAHALLRQVTGVQGIDLSQFDLDKQDDFNNWLGYHQTEHQQLRQALGIS
jgi:hypothetical protein